MCPDLLNEIFSGCSLRYSPQLHHLSICVKTMVEFSSSCNVLIRPTQSCNQQNKWALWEYGQEGVRFIKSWPRLLSKWPFRHPNCKRVAPALQQQSLHSHSGISKDTDRNIVGHISLTKKYFTQVQWHMWQKGSSWLPSIISLIGKYV